MANRDLARALWRFSWRWLPGRTAIAHPDLIAACVALFSSDYAIWGASGSRPGQHVKLAPRYLRELLESPDSWIVCAFDGDVLVGYAIVLRFESRHGHRVAWIAQLVVRSTYRQSRVATTLLFSAWQFSDFHAWGIVTANPYAVRALETATRRPCRAKVIIGEGQPILEELRQRLPYLPPDFDTVDDRPVPSVDTKFPIDLSELERMKDNAARHDRPWNLGMIHEGHEWFAATFSSQAPSVARGDYLNELLEGIDAIWIRAYEGMTLDSDHAWHRYSEPEVAWILERLDLPTGARVLDAGCGDGRHAIALAKRGFKVTGTDVSERLLERAKQRAEDENVEVEFVLSDLRVLASIPEGPFELAVCLYDVVGSSADPADDLALLSNIRERLADDGVLVMSVMSSASTLQQLPGEQRPGSAEEFVTALERLPPSRQMEQSGSVFDPRYIVFFDERFYRKEQFDVADDLPPSELVVRDRRFSAQDVVGILEQAGYDVIEVHGVRAGRWSDPTDANSPDAREILLVAEPRLA